MFRVSTLDLENLPRNDQGKVDFDKDFFGKESFLTVSGQLNGRDLCLRTVENLHLRPNLPRRKLQHQPPPGGVLDAGAGSRLRGA